MRTTIFWVHVVPLLGYEQIKISRDDAARVVRADEDEDENDDDCNGCNIRHARTVAALVMGNKGISSKAF